MDLALTAEQQELRRAPCAAGWTTSSSRGRSRTTGRSGFPSEALEGMRDLGLIGLTIPQEYGGGGADPFDYVLTIEELARGDANVRSILSVHLGLVAGPVHALGHRRAEGALASGDGVGGDARLLRADRAGRRVGSGEPAQHRRAHRRRLRPQRQQDLHHERHDRRPRVDHGAHRRAGRQGRERVPGADRHRPASARRK